MLQKRITGAVAKTTQPSIQIVSTARARCSPTTRSKPAGGANQARIRAHPSATDPKANFTDPTAIRYTLDPVDDLAPGTYVINIEFADAGRGPGNAAEPPYVDYRTPTVKVATFQVKQATARSRSPTRCTACHWSSAGAGFVLDYPRHNKLFNDRPSTSAAAATTTSRP